MPVRLAIKALFLFFAASLAGQQPASKTAPSTPRLTSSDVSTAQSRILMQAPVLIIQGIGKGVVPIDGSWQFHEGDDPRWSRRDLDDSAWESIEVDSPWGTQHHPSYAGFAWYRRHVEILPTAGATQDYRLLIPHAEDAYEVYWNGVLMGTYGHLPPHPNWYYGEFPRSFPLCGSAYGILAIRVWRAPLEAFSAEETGGLYATPLECTPCSPAAPLHSRLPKPP